MAKYIEHKQLTSTIGLTECRDGFWLYDETRGMNLAMRAETPEAAFVEALEYYQNRLAEVEKRERDLAEKIAKFVSQFTTDNKET